MTITPEQFNKLLTKEDLKEFASKLEFKEYIDKVMGKLNAIMVKLDNIEHAFVSNLAAHGRFEERISRIENHLGFNQLKANARQ